MADRVRTAREALERAVQAERDRALALRKTPEPQPPPAPAAAKKAPAKKGATKALGAASLPPAPALAGEEEQPEEPPAPPEDLDERACELAEALAEENDEFLAKVGIGMFVVLGAVAGWAVWQAWDAHCDNGGVCFARGGGVVRAQLSMPVIAFAVAVLLAVVFNRSGGLRQFLIGKDGRFSTSATQALMWTVAIAYVLGFVVIAHAWGAESAPVPDKPFEHLDLPYLLLLGGPFAAAGLARFSTARKIEDGEEQKVGSAEARIADVVTDDDGRASLVDLQFFVFNLVALAFFIGKFADKSTQLPEMPLELVGLTSLAALTYTGTKIAERNAPIVTSVTRRNGDGPVRVGDEVVVNGANFLPPGARRDEQQVSLRVRFGKRDVRVVADAAAAINPVTSSRIVVSVPSDVTPGDVNVSVVTAAGIESGTFPVKIVADKPVVTAVRRLPVVPGARVEVLGRFFTPPGDRRAKPTVTFDGVPVNILGYDDEHVRVVAPPTLAGDTTTIAVRSASGLVASDAVDIPVAAP